VVVRRCDGARWWEEENTEAFGASTRKERCQVEDELGGQVGKFGVRTRIELQSSILRVGVTCHPNSIVTRSKLDPN